MVLAKSGGGFYEGPGGASGVRRSMANKLPGRCGDWLVTTPSKAHTPARLRRDEQGVGALTWPPSGSFSWRGTANLGLLVGRGLDDLFTSAKSSP